MTDDPLDLWPESIRADQLSPLAILRLQATKLSQKTGGLLSAEVVSGRESVSDEDLTIAPSGAEAVHRFEVIAPRLDGYRYQMFVCRHDSELVYPAYIEDDDAHELRQGESIRAATQDEFVALVRKVFASKKHVGAISSMLAKIAELNTASVPA